MDSQLPQEKILFIDDESNILDGIRRQLKGRYSAHFALGAEEALAAFEANEQFAVVISDLRMPQIDGIELLRRVQELSPDTVRLVLTGNKDQQSAIDAVNTGNVFRFLTKPCDRDLLIQTLEASLSQYRLVTAEKELLNETLNNLTRVMTEVVGLSDPKAFNFGSALRNFARHVAVQIGVDDVWEVELGARLASLGYMTIPSEVRNKVYAGLELTADELAIVQRYPEFGKSLIAGIARLEGVANIIYYQNKNYDGSGFPNDDIAGKRIPVGARILKVLLDLAQLQSKRIDLGTAIKQLHSREGAYDPEVLKVVGTCMFSGEVPGRNYYKRNPLEDVANAVLDSDFNNTQLSPTGVRDVETTKIFVKDLRIGSIVVNDLKSKNGVLLLSAGDCITESGLARIRNYYTYSGIEEPFEVYRGE